MVAANGSRLADDIDALVRGFSIPDQKARLAPPAIMVLIQCTLVESSALVWSALVRGALPIATFSGIRQEQVA
jgi:hypothetical protein